MAICHCFGAASGQRPGAQTTPAGGDRFDFDRTTVDLRKVARDPDEAVKLFHTHTDEIVEKFDRGYLSSDAQPIQGSFQREIPIHPETPG